MSILKVLGAALGSTTALVAATIVTASIIAPSAGFAASTTKASARPAIHLNAKSNKLWQAQRGGAFFAPGDPGNAGADGSYGDNPGAAPSSGGAGGD